ncbi:MAG: ankyrin repeat domain-containing protein [Acidobacteriia bacterium]|nr:ankyrin repeat domain-containing protein [Terriglobia bacterium]
MLSTKFIWLLHPVYIRVPRIAYFSAYDTNCAQITDRELLGKIAKTGLENELKEFAIAKTAQSPWWTFEHIHRAFHGSATVDVVDDPWLPVSRTFLFPQRGRDRPPEIVVDGDLQQLNALLASRRFSQDELDGALTETSAWLDDECFIRRLIEAGANPNFRNPDAETPLMFAAEAGHVHAVQALLEAGADPAAKNSLGETALVLARRRQYQRIVSLLARKPGGPG